MRLELWFDFSCPYAYLASTQAEALAARTGAELEWRPMLLGGVFRARETPQKLFVAMSPARVHHNAVDLVRWAKRFGVPYAMPSGHPIRTVLALRALLVLGVHRADFIHRCFRAYWVQGLDLAERDVVAELLREVGAAPEAVLVEAESSRIKDELRARTDEAIERGVFGAPSMFVGERMFFGQDRLGAVEAALSGQPEARLSGQPAARLTGQPEARLSGQPAARLTGQPKARLSGQPEARLTGQPDATVQARGTPSATLWLDLACPEALLAVREGLALLGDGLSLRLIDAAALLRADYPPEGVLPASHPVKQRYLADDRRRRFAAAGCAPPPVETGLRHDTGALVAFLEGLRLEGHAGFRAALAEAAEALLALEPPVAILERLAAAHDGALDDRVGAGQDGLREATAAARALGVPGVPTWHVADAEDGGLYFGLDRLGLLLDLHAPASLTSPTSATGLLAGRHCEACDGDTPPAPRAFVDAALAELPGWSLEADHHLTRTYAFPDFAEALAFVNRVGAIAEAEGHHPDIALAWGRVRLDIFTHSIGALSENDLVLAALIEAGAVRR